MTLKLLLAVFVTTLLCESECTGNGAKCFNCSTLSDSTCSDPFSARGRNPSVCSQGAVCVKVKTESEVRRGCTQTAGVQITSMQSGHGANCVTDVVPPSFETRTICRCDTNLCNTAYKTDIGFSVVAIVVVTSLLIWIP